MNDQLSPIEIKAVLLDLLKNIKQICDQYGLRYYLAGGTLLGAIRHQGFIPWDDDIDITMPRMDLEKMVEIFKQRQSDHIKLLTNYSDRIYFNLHAKLVDTRTRKVYRGVRQIMDAGVNVDIFPLDGLPKNETDIRRYEKKLNYYKSIWWGAISESNLSGKKGLIRLENGLFHCFCKIIGYQIPIRRIEKLVKKYEFDNSDYVGEFVSVLGLKAKVSRKAFETQVKVQFEDDVFNAPVGYHEYLSVLYGDYMKLPPVEKRIKHHINDIFWK